MSEALSLSHEQIPGGFWDGAIVEREESERCAIVVDQGTFLRYCKQGSNLEGGHTWLSSDWKLVLPGPGHRNQFGLISRLREVLEGKRIPVELWTPKLSEMKRQVDGVMVFDINSSELVEFAIAVNNLYRSGALVPLRTD